MATFEEKRNQLRNDTINHYGVLLLGNAGVGKSFLANILAGSDSFIHGISSKAVTQEAECVEMNIGDSSLTIFDIPGLIEAEREHIDSNIVEIDKAFYERPCSMIIFIFGHENGRIRAEDVAAMNAMNVAYSFESESLAIIVNNLPKNRPKNYESTTVPHLQNLLGSVNVMSDKIFFINNIDTNSIDEKELLRHQLFQILLKSTFSRHQKKETVQTLMKQLKICQEELVEQEELFDIERRKFREKIIQNQELSDRMVAQYQLASQSLRKTLKSQMEEILVERRRFNIHSENATDEINQAKRDLRKMKEKIQRLRKE